MTTRLKSANWLDEHLADFNKGQILPGQGFNKQEALYNDILEHFAKFYKKSHRSVTAVGTLSVHELEHLKKHFKTIRILNLYGHCFTEAMEQGLKVEADYRFGQPDDAGSYQPSDVILTAHTFNFFEDPHAVLKAMKGALKPNGIICIAVQNAEMLTRRLALAMGLIPDIKALSATEIKWKQKRQTTMDDLNKAAAQAGLKVISTGGSCLKTLTEAQYETLKRDNLLPEGYDRALYEIGHAFPQLCQTIHIVAQSKT